MSEEQKNSLSGSRLILPSGLLLPLFVISVIEILSFFGIQIANPGALCFGIIVYATYVGGFGKD